MVPNTGPEHLGEILIFLLSFGCFFHVPGAYINLGKEWNQKGTSSTSSSLHQPATALTTCKTVNKHCGFMKNKTHLTFE